MGSCANLYKPSIDKNIILTIENNNSSLKKVNSNNLKTQNIPESNNSYKTDFSNPKNIINKEVNKNQKYNLIKKTRTDYQINNDKKIKSEKIDYLINNNNFDIDDDNESIVINDIVDLLSIGIKYQDNNINDYKTETFYNKERTFTDSKSE